MAAYRHIHIDYWQDSFILDLTPEEKYFYIYLMTNSKTTQCGVYDLHHRIIETETGYNRETVEKLIKRFVEYKKIHYCEETKEIFLITWLKYNMSHSPKVQKCIKKEIEKIKNKEFVKMIYDTLEKLGYNIDNIKIDKNMGDKDGKHNNEYRKHECTKSFKDENEQVYHKSANDELENLRRKFKWE